MTNAMRTYYVTCRTKAQARLKNRLIRVWACTRSCETRRQDEDFCASTLTSGNVAVGEDVGGRSCQKDETTGRPQHIYSHAYSAVSAFGGASELSVVPRNSSAFVSQLPGRNLRRGKRPGMVATSMASFCVRSIRRARPRRVEVRLS